MKPDALSRALSAQRGFTLSEITRIARRNPRTSDFTRNLLRRALRSDNAGWKRYPVQIEALLESTGLEGAPVIPVSTVTGEGLDTLRAALAASV